MKNKYNIGLEIFCINSVLVGYIMTSEGDMLSNSIIASISTIVAIIINYLVYKKEKNIKLNLLFICLNLIILIICIIFLIKSII